MNIKHTWQKRFAAIALGSMLSLVASPVSAAKPVDNQPAGQAVRLEKQLAKAEQKSAPAPTTESGSSVDSSTTTSSPTGGTEPTSSTATSSTDQSTTTSSTPSELSTTSSSTTTTTTTTAAPKVKPAKPTGSQTNPIVQSNSLVPTDCNQTEWHWIINQLNGRTKPASITVFFDSGSVVVPLDTTQSSKDVAHYTLTSHLGDALVAPGATTTLENVSSWTGRFNLSHGPCIVPLEVSKTADTSFTRTWDWTITKTADQSDLGEQELGDQSQITVNYEVTVDATSTDSDFLVSGTISIHNSLTNPEATIESVADVLSIEGAVDVDCGVTFPHVLATDDTLECTYSTSLSGPVNQTNTATVTTSGDVPGGSANANVVFATDPTEEIDECVDVSDTFEGSLGEVCAADAPETFNYSVTFSQAEGSDILLECGQNTHTNTASFVTNDTAASGEDSVVVTAQVPCADNSGCTLTQGYWKTHSEFGPAASDPVWDLLTDGANTTFFLSGQTWYEVFQTEPAGNAYYQLAHQYMAAQLNQLAGASIPGSVSDAFDDATKLFNTYTPAQIASANDTLMQQFVDLAGILAGYNEGLSGPGHCGDEEVVS
jgi:hypothetical protein